MRASRSTWGQALKSFVSPLPEVEVSPQGVIQIRQRRGVLLRQESLVTLGDRAALWERRRFGRTLERRELELAQPRKMWSYAVRDPAGAHGVYQYLTLIALEDGRFLVLVLGNDWFAGRRVEDAIAKLPAYQGRILAMEMPGFLPRRTSRWKSGVYRVPDGLTEPGPETMLVTPQRRRITENLED